MDPVCDGGLRGMLFDVGFRDVSIGGGLFGILPDIIERRKLLEDKLEIGSSVERVLEFCVGGELCERGWRVSG